MKQKIDYVEYAGKIREAIGDTLYQNLERYIKDEYATTLKKYNRPGLLERLVVRTTRQIMNNYSKMSFDNT